MMSKHQKLRRKKRRVSEPLTEELLNELLSSGNPAAFIEERVFKTTSLSQHLQQLLDERGLKRSDVIRMAGLNQTFGYQIFMGQRGASRDKILQIAFAMKVSLKECNRLLKLSGANELYCKNRRDAIIIFCLDKGYTLQKTDDELYRFGEETIS